MHVILNLKFNVHQILGSAGGGVEGSPSILVGEKFLNTSMGLKMSQAYGWG